VNEEILINVTPQETRVAVMQQGVAQELHVGQLMLLLQFGNMSRDLAMYNTKLYAEQVMPQIKDLWDDEWENRWWPKPMARAERATPKPLGLQAAE